MLGSSSSLNRNFWWAVHNLIGHPVMELAYWVGLRRFSAWVHDVTLPKLDNSPRLKPGDS